MISINVVKEILNEVIASRDLYIVDISISKNNKIKILIDKPDGVSIDDCVQISRFVERKLNRDHEDFELEVSSPGLNEPFRVRQQYEKNVGRDVEVITSDGVKHKGKLLNVSDNEIVLEELKKIKSKGSKKKKMIKEELQLSFKDIKNTKAVVSFK